jgi:hypothetical protein
MLTGAGVATADDGTSPGAQTSSGSDTGSDESKAGPSVQAATDTPPASDESTATDAGKHRKKQSSEETTDNAPVDPSESEDADEEDADEEDADEDDEAPAAQESEKQSEGKHAAPEPPDPAPVVTEGAETVGEHTDSASADIAANVETPSSFVSSIETDLSSHDGAAVMQLAAARTPALPRSNGFNLFDYFSQLSTDAYDLYVRAMHSLAGPARAPFGSPVRVESSELTIGDDVAVSADWYFPPGSTPATGLIYLQHGLWATSRFYGATAAYIAEKTHSIVVVPTLTWNALDVDNYPLTLPDTHRAIADLFTGDRLALTASAHEAGFLGDLPTRVVLAGHSAGGGLVVGTARYMVEQAAATNLAGVVMLDGVGIVGVMDMDLQKIPHTIPVYNLAGAPSSWNTNGLARYQLAFARPGMFTGVRMWGGRHSDSMQSTSSAVQFMSYLATGFSSPLNIVANRVLSAGWINDLLLDTHTPGLYGAISWPVGVVARALISPARNAATVNVGVAPLGAATCPVDSTLLSCNDQASELAARREVEGVGTRAV